MSNGPQSASTEPAVRAFAVSVEKNHQNTAKYPSDATGAFLPGARRFGAAYRCGYKTFDNIGAAATVRRRFLKTIEDHCPGNTNLFAYFGHGTKNGISSAECFRDTVDDLLRILKPRLSFPCAIVLYACSAGAAGGYTGLLRDKLGESAWVYGHTTAGHAFVNPDVSEEATSRSPSFRLMYPTGSDLRREWSQGLEYSDLWLRFPLMDDFEIESELYARRLMGTWEVRFDGGSLWQYEFEMPSTTWRIAPGRPYFPTPRGTVVAKKAGKVGDKGSWYVTNAAVMKWDSGKSETWPLPLQVSGQRGDSEGYPLTANRISPAKKLGVLQR